MAFRLSEIRWEMSSQLAAARYFHEQSSEPLTFAYFDKRQNAAARSSGLRLLAH